MRHLPAVFLLLVSMLPAAAQDSLYARKTIRFLTSKACYGRGYLRSGLNTAAKYIEGELKALQVQPLQAGSYFQPFHFNVNTFPGKVAVKLNGRTLKPGEDYIVSPESAGLRGSFTLQKKDSVTYTAVSGDRPLLIRLKKKLTFSVATEAADYCEIELLDNGTYGDLRTARVDIRNKVLTPFEAKNIIGFLQGQNTGDTLVVFSAHYDHLGGMGKKTYFPGANDNASGVSVLLNLAKYYKAHPPRYTTLFIFFAGEEAGLIGSKFFTESGLVNLKKIKFLVNLDLLGTGDDGIMVVNGALHEKQFAQLQKINTEQQLVKEIKKRGKAKNSDHYWFTEAGVPCFFIYTLGGTTSYHDVFDVEEKLPLTDYRDVFRLITTFVERL